MGDARSGCVHLCIVCVSESNICEVAEVHHFHCHRRRRPFVRQPIAQLNQSDCVFALIATCIASARVSPPRTQFELLLYLTLRVLRLAHKKKTRDKPQASSLVEVCVRKNLSRRTSELRSVALLAANYSYSSAEPSAFRDTTTVFR